MIYGLLFEVAAETLIRIAADPKHLGARIGATLVLHTWGSALTHHPHVHGIVPGGGLAADGERWIGCRPGFFLPVRVLSRLFRRRFLEELEHAHRAGRLRFFGEHAALADAATFARWLAPLRRTEWVVYAKRPFAGPQAVLAYLARYTHRVAIANSRLLAMDERGVTLPLEGLSGPGQDTLQDDDARRQPSSCAASCCTCCPAGFHRIRHYGLLANTGRRMNLAVARHLLQQPAADLAAPLATDTTAAPPPTFICRQCGAPMIVVELLARPLRIRAPPTPLARQ